jgi:hypothetical protein
MKKFLANGTVSVLPGLALFLILSCLPVMAKHHVKRALAEGLPIPRHTLALNGPISSHPFWCDWERKNDHTNGMAAATVNFTRALPQNGWVATVHYDYATGTKLDQEFQIFNPRKSYNQPKTPAAPKRLLGTNWDFQLTNGAVRCQLFVSSSSGEMRFSKCTNGVEQYCLSRKFPELLIDKKFHDCNSGTIKDQAACLERGVSEGSPLTTLDNDPVCAEHPVACLTFISFQRTLHPGEISLFEFMNITPSDISDEFVKAVLEGLRQDWLDFTNQSLGGCESSHLCPGGTFCSQGSCQRLFSF